MQQQTTIDAYEEPSLDDLRAERVQTHSFLASAVLRLKSCRVAVLLLRGVWSSLNLLRRSALCSLRCVVFAELLGGS